MDIEQISTSIECEADDNAHEKIDIADVSDGNVGLDSSDHANHSGLVPLAAPKVEQESAQLVPSLRGKLAIDGNVNICRGLWAMSDEAHEQPGQTSDFEFKLVKSFENAVAFPFSGKYQGWFTLKQPAPLKSLKIEDKDLNIRFTSRSDGGHSVEGEGSNKFGSFTLIGSLSIENMLQMYRTYVPKPVPVKRTSTGNAAGGSAAKSKKKTVSLIDPDALTISVDSSTTVATPRGADGSGRTRKKSNFGIGFDTSDEGPAPTILAPTPKAAPTPRSSSVPSTVSQPTSSFTSARSPRMSPYMLKCGELLKELTRQPHSIWFLEPVDHVKLQIPDYPVIIKEPMDFFTIRQNLDAGVYATPEAFADHVRLVFRNAMTFNSQRDSPVHIAAREVSTKFEDKFRAVLAQLGSQSSSAAFLTGDELRCVSSTGGAGSRKSVGGKPTLMRAASSGAGAPKGRMSMGAGPRAAEAYLPPPLDTTAHHLVEMQRKMQEMQDEIMKLRTAVQKTEVQKKIEVQRDAAQNPLTFEEKKVLIAEISRLPGERMVEVVEMIRSVHPTNSSKEEGDEIEIPLDELDTLTLRRLQRYVEDVNSNDKKKRVYTPVASKEPAGKRIKREKSAGAGRGRGASKSSQGGGAFVDVGETSSNGTSFEESSGDQEKVESHAGQDIEDGAARASRPADEEEVEAADLLFSAESFEDLRANAAANNEASDVEEDDEALDVVAQEEYSYY